MAQFGSQTGAAQNFMDFLNSGDGAGFMDFLKRGIDKTLFGDQDLNRALGNFSITGVAPLTGFGASGIPLGLASLNNILASQGRTDPSLFNRQLAGIARGTEAEQLGLQGSLAQSNLQGSGVGQAIQAAIGQAGQDRIAGARAQEARLAEERKRSDLDLLLKLLIEPALAAGGVFLDVNQQERDRRQRKNEAIAEAFRFGIS